jgi:hypothetical protein
MLSVEESKAYLRKFNLTEKQVEQFRNAAYSIVNEILDELYETEAENRI